MKFIFNKYQINELIIAEKFGNSGRGFHIIEVVNHNGKITIEKEHHFYSLEMVKKLSVKKPLILIFNDQYVVHNTFPETENIPQITSDIIQQKFNYQHFNIVSFTRKKEVEDTINELHQSFIIEFFIGPWSLFFLKSKGLIEENAITTTNHKINFIPPLSINPIEEVEKHETIIIGEEKISNNSVLSLSAAISYFIQGETYQEGAIPIFDTVKKEHYNFFIFNKVKNIFFIFFPLILLISMWLHQKSESQFSVLEEEYEDNKRLSNTLNEKIAEVNSKSDIISTFNLIGNQEYTYFLHLIGLETPKKVVLNKIFFNKIDNSSFKDGTIIQSKLKSIEISGFTPEVTIVNSWTKALIKNEFIRDISIIELDGHKKDNNFKIEVHLE